MKRFLFFLVLSSILLISATQSDAPKTKISNSLIEANLYLPDSVNGYYRGMRFDWSGVISSLQYKGHDYFGQWFAQYKPDLHDAIMGPVEEFAPIDYDKAMPGELFLKPGVGMLVKNDNSKYSFSKTFKIQNHGSWKVKQKQDQVQFIQTLKAEKYSYQYEKVVKLVKDKPQLVLSHTLKNTGKNTIETEVYDHNFFMIDKAPSGPDIRIKFQFNPEGKFTGRSDLVKISDKQLKLENNLAKGEQIHTVALTGFGEKSSDYDFRIENIKTGAGVRITCDKPLLRMVLWGNPNTLCPEPYIKIKVEPGQEFSWNIYYDFYTFDKEL